MNKSCTIYEQVIIFLKFLTFLGGWVVLLIFAISEGFLGCLLKFELFMTCSHLIHNLFMTHSWLVHDMFTSCSQFVYALSITCSWITHCSLFVHNFLLQLFATFWIHLKCFTYTTLLDLLLSIPVLHLKCFT